jgi:endoglucanase
MKLLKKLCEAFGPTGFEDEVAKIVTSELKPVCREVRTDTMGNVIGLIKGKGPEKKRKKIMVAGHMDEIGFVVTHINDKGFIRFAPLGGFNPRSLDTKRITLLGKGRHKLSGILNVAERPIWLQTPEERKKELTLNDFYVDLCLPADEVKKKVEIGDPFVWDGPYVRVGDCATSKAMDDRVGVYIMLEAMKRVKNNTHDIYAVGSVQEEVGLRGATTSAYEINPDIGIACDIMGAMDTPGCPEHESITCLGGGIALSIKDGWTIADPALVSEFRKLAAKHKIPYQMEVSPMGGTDAGAMQRARSGSRAITLSIPTRYGHSAVETVHKTDVDAGIDLLARFLSQ